jgi:hypothetical protein
MEPCQKQGKPSDSFSLYDGILFPTAREKQAKMGQKNYVKQIYLFFVKVFSESFHAATLVFDSLSMWYDAAAP